MEVCADAHVDVTGAEAAQRMSSAKIRKARSSIQWVVVVRNTFWFKLNTVGCCGVKVYIASCGPLLFRSGNSTPWNPPVPVGLTWPSQKPNTHTFAARKC